MPTIKHTPEQERVINLRGKSMLVSAAAGSGKTRVLVDRILSLITDEKNPIDIDKILVVTFTNAAAGEMKERICDALEEAYYKDPENRHLARQMAISHTAMVTTIDSFSNQILKEFFSEIDLDPDFRTGDVGELELLHQECMDRIIEREYERADETFLRLTDIYRERGKDGSLKKIISAVFKRAESAPWPEDYIDHAADFYDIDTEDALFDSEVMRYTLRDIKSKLLSIEAVYERIIATMDPSDTPDKFIKIFPQDLSVVQDLLSKGSVKDIMTYTLSFETLSRSKTPDDQKEREEYLKKKREELKNAVKKAIESVNGMAPSEILSVIRLSKPYANEIIRLTKLFREEFSLAKRKQGIIDFSDMEHMALSILIDKETGQCRPPAKELRERYSYVMVDEYQDSNEVQELLLKTVSGEDTGCYNYFMVGDVKQSIYRFRMAQPKIFMKKHALFEKENENTKRIDLNKNFRSRTEVLDIVNGIFSHIMKKDIGGIDYTDSEKLYPGAEFKDAPEGADAFTPEVLIAENDAEAIEELLMDDKEELEAAIIADRIDALMKNAVVTDPDTRELRPIRYSDICILLRSVKTKGEVFADTLKTHHIPSHVAGKKGYYDSAEVRTVLQFLSLIDNGYQDIPLVAVLRSPMFDISDETLINARLCDREAPFNNAFYEYAKETDDEGVRKFTEIYEKLREASLDTGVSDLIRMMLEETGYLTFVTAMPDGDVRNANLRKLMDKAADYEKTGFKGLFRFIRYIENLRTYDADEESAEVVSENDDAVKIMTIHKSKGLEFPVVFVSGMGSQLRAVEKEKVTLNPELGLAIDAVDPVNMVKYKSFYREQMKSLNAHEDKGEELRVLYVALTRAKEKLIMTGVVKKLDETMLKWRETDIDGYLERKNTACFFDMVMPVILRTGYENIVKEIGTDDIIYKAVTDAAENLEKERTFMSSVQETDQEDTKRLKEIMDFEYPFTLHTVYKNKYSVSEIKHRAMDKVIEDEQAENMQKKEKEFSPTVPAFMSEDKEKGVNEGALRGTAMHRYMECFDFHRNDYKEAYTSELTRMYDEGKLEEKQKALLSREKIETFLKSDLARRMHDAALRDELYEERAFVFGDTAESLFSGIDEAAGGENKDLIMVQGIIDAFFIEDGEIVVLDYKTDRVKNADELKALYNKQLEIYGNAISKAFDMPVKEKYLYSFSLNETILLGHDL